MIQTHPLVTQLRFARTEFVRCLEGVTDTEARRRFGQMNCISWIIGHMAAQEKSLWVESAQSEDPAPHLEDLVGYSKPASTPPLAEMWATWQTVTKMADPYLDSISDEMLDQHLTWRGQPLRDDIGTYLLRVTYHYWFHLGEAHAIRQQLGHQDLPDFVGYMTAVRYR